jgi:hemoglobin
MFDPEKSLYQRLGGYDTIAAFVDDLLPRLFADPRLGAYWKGKSKDSLTKERQLVVDFLCAAFGGPVFYVGRDMKTSHEGLRITDQEWDLFVAHTVATLDNLGIPEREKSDLLAAAGSLKGDIVEVPQAAS